MTELKKWQSMRSWEMSGVLPGILETSATPTLRNYLAAVSFLINSRNDSIGEKQALCFVRMHCGEIMKSFEMADSRKIFMWCKDPTGSGLGPFVVSLFETAISTEDESTRKRNRSPKQPPHDRKKEPTNTKERQKELVDLGKALVSKK